jgi:hypothetical protein
VTALVYSHGIGTDETDRGLFTDIANAFPQLASHLFRYDRVEGNKIHLNPMSVYKAKLNAAIESAASKDQRIVIISHSFGCLCPLIISNPAITGIFLLAPRPKMEGHDIFQRWAAKYQGMPSMHEQSIIKRTDGTYTVFNPDFWSELGSHDLVALAAQLSKRIPIHVITAKHEDEQEFADAERWHREKINSKQLDANHDFSSEARKVLIEEIATRLEASGFLS